MTKTRLVPLLMLALVCTLAVPAAARPEICEDAARTAAREAGIPADVLLAVALTETGRRIDGRLRPWPWAANADGRSHWFATRDEALAFAQARLDQGRPSFDLGCFQINWRWHGDTLASPAVLLDPVAAARYAAGFLARLRAEFGTWEAAAGAYLSRTPALAQRYRARFVAILATLRGAPDPGTAPAPEPDRAPYPLLSGHAAGASLVPVALPAVRPLFEVRR